MNYPGIQTEVEGVKDSFPNVRHNFIYSNIITKSNFMPFHYFRLKIIVFQKSAKVDKHHNRHPCSFFQNTHIRAHAHTLDNKCHMQSPPLAVWQRMHCRNSWHNVMENGVTFRILSPGRRTLEAGPSGCTLVTKIPYKSKVI